MLKTPLLRAIGVIAVSVLAGCASFPKEYVAKVDQMPDVSQYQNKPSVYIDLRFFHGKPGQATAPVEMAAAKPVLQQTVQKVVTDSNLFSSYSFDEFEKDKMDYTLKIYAYNHGEVGAAAVMGFLCGFTFGVIPAAATDNYTLEVDAIDQAGTMVSEANNQDAITTWMGLWFIPLMGNTPNEAVSETLENQLRAALKEMIESGKLNYSWLQTPYFKA